MSEIKRGENEEIAGIRRQEYESLKLSVIMGVGGLEDKHRGLAEKIEILMRLAEKDKSGRQVEGILTRLRGATHSELAEEFAKWVEEVYKRVSPSLED